MFPYLTRYSYYDDELNIIRDNTISIILTYTNLSSFTNQKNYIVNDAPSYKPPATDGRCWYLSTELSLTNATPYTSTDSNRDCTKLSRLFKVLQMKCKDNYSKLSQACINAYSQMLANPYDKNILQTYQSLYVRCCEFEKKYQYFIYSDIRFISITKPAYDRFGKRCLLIFSLCC